MYSPTVPLAMPLSVKSSSVRLKAFFEDSAHLPTVTLFLELCRKYYLYPVLSTIVGFAQLGIEFVIETRYMECSKIIILIYHVTRLFSFILYTW